ncbi:hypothetical protein EDD63_12612 [Breznakia blatticola]|uniref:Uncharacterized protein n=1 Tax=Breznakia blatticola TaxID=1754012 RepID=A0A4R7ZIP6_9FIRM|nr:hypothetical protein EDD63_12612 [Breznakia blatticola]
MHNKEEYCCNQLHKINEEIANATATLSTHIDNLMNFYSMCSEYINQAWEAMVEKDKELADKISFNYIVEHKEEYRKILEDDYGIDADALQKVSLEKDSNQGGTTA